MILNFSNYFTGIFSSYPKIPKTWSGKIPNKTIQIMHATRKILYKLLIGIVAISDEWLTTVADTLR